MSILADYYTQAELIKELNKRGIKKSMRALQIMRQKRVGPPWTKFGKTIFYSGAGFRSYLESAMQHPVRSRRRA
jgi:hypothetical protein